MRYYDAPKPAFVGWITNFATVATANAAALGLTPGDIADIASVKNTYVGAYEDQLAAISAAKGAVTECDQAWDAALTVVSKFNKIFQAKPGLSPELLAELGLTVPSADPSTVPVYVPSNPSAMGSSNGVNTLRWWRNGNSSGTTYVVEVDYDGLNDWAILDSTTRCKYEHGGQTPGRFIRYRVYAQRGTRKSFPSGTAAVYDPATGLTVEEGGQAAA
jgi:hypothetical protein